MEVYFDNSATTRVLDEVKDLTVKLMTEDYGNPSARHRKGMEAEQYVKNAASQIAKTLKVKEKEILFTSGGTAVSYTHLDVYKRQAPDTPLNFSGYVPDFF